MDVRRLVMGLGVLIVVGVGAVAVLVSDWMNDSGVSEMMGFITSPAPLPPVPAPPFIVAPRWSTSGGSCRSTAARSSAGAPG